MTGLLTTLNDHLVRCSRGHPLAIIWSFNLPLRRKASRSVRLSCALGRQRDALYLIGRQGLDIGAGFMPNNSRSAQCQAASTKAGKSTARWLLHFLIAQLNEVGYRNGGPMADVGMDGAASLGAGAKSLQIFANESTELCMSPC
jgi:hypothetical protein